MRLLAPNGNLGSGFLVSSLQAAAADGVDVIACDSGSTDNGPYYLGSTRPLFPAPMYRRDLHHILLASRGLRVPLIIGSAAGSGCDAGVDFLVTLIAEIAADEGLGFRLARIYSEQPKAYIEKKLAEGAIAPLFPATDLTPQTIDRAERIVAMMGTEPIIEALGQGVDVIVTGRASDSALFASFPLMHGVSPGIAWHAGKILECGAAATVQRLMPDCMMASLEDDGFVVWAPNGAMECSPLSVAAHTLYENGDPFRIREPPGTLDTSACVYESAGNGRVRVLGSRFEPDEYTVKLEAVESVGYHSFAVAGIRDPLLLASLPTFLDQVQERSRQKLSETVPFRPSEYSSSIRVYGLDGAGPRLDWAEGIPGEVGVMIEAFGPTQEAADAIASTLFYVALHNPVEGWKGMLTNLAVPFSPAVVSTGIAYQFSMNHVVRPATPTEMFRTEIEEIS